MITKIIYLSVILCISCFAQEYPLRDPKASEARPSWWLDCYAGNIVVIEGVIFFNDDQKEDIHISFEKEAVKTAFTKQEQLVQKHFSKFYLGHIRPRKLLFASPGISLLNHDIRSLVNGEFKNIDVIIPLFETDGGKLLTLGVHNKQNAVFIFKYGNVVPLTGFIFNDIIQRDDVRQAQQIFNWRKNGRKLKK